MKFCKEMAGFA